MAVDLGPATGNASMWLGVPPTVSIEVHVGNALGSAGINSLAPSDQNVPVDPGIGTTLQTQTKLNMFLGGSSTIKFLNPA